MRKSKDNGFFTATIYGEPASKANMRKIVLIRGKPRVIKSEKALNYLSVFRQQCRKRDPLLTGDLSIGMRIFYGSLRPDLDESLILDALQDYAYKNDRQIKTKYIVHGLDRERPRTQIVVGEREKIRDIIDFIDVIGGA